MSRIQDNTAAIILAAGIGSRLNPLTLEKPKSLIKVNNREILDYQIKGYQSAGIKLKNIIVITGYKTDMIEKFLDENYPEVTVITNEDYKTTNNMYSLYLGLRYVKNNLKNINTLIINNADCIYSEKTMQKFINSDLKNSIAVQPGCYITESMKISVNNENKITDISKNLPEEESFGVSVDFYKYSDTTIDELFNIIKDFVEIKKDLNRWTEVAFPLLFLKSNVYPFDINNEKWIEIDNMEDLIQADRLFSDFNLTDKKALICDLDGTMFIGSKPIEPAVNFIKNNSEKLDFYFLTNNTSKIPADYVEKISSTGISLTEDKILTPLTPLISYIKTKNYKSIYLAANKKVSEYLKQKLPDVEFEYNYDKNEAIVLTYDTEINYEKLKNISVLINNKRLKYLATHTDVFCPTEENNIPDIGSFIELIYKTTNKKPDIIFGKPSIRLIQGLIDKYGTEHLAIAGDRIYTDKKLADNAGVDFICVLSGETTRTDIFHDETNAPQLILNNLGELETSACCK